MGISADVTVGHTTTVERTISDGDVALFALITGDHHPLHLDEYYASTTPFGQRIVPVALVSGIIEAALGATIPGSYATIREHALSFPQPLPVEDTLAITITVTAHDGAAQATCQITATRNDGAQVACGQVTLHLTAMPPTDDDDLA